MNTYKHRLFNREISMQVLCGLTWMNVALSAIILIQHQAVGSQQAYLIGRTPADFVMHNTAEGRVSSSAQDVIELSDRTLVSNSSSAPYIETESVTSFFSIHTSSESSASSENSESSLRHLPYLESVDSSASVSPKKKYPSNSIETSMNASAIDTSQSSSRVENLRPAAQEPVVATPNDFPVFGNAVHPVAEVPDWGAMKNAAQWNRPYAQMKKDDFVPIPSYNIGSLMIPMKELLATRDQPNTIKILTEKLYYSTRFFGAYDLDAGEFSAIHPGIDLKLAEGTPIGAVAGGRVHDVRHDEQSLGLHIIVEHRADDGRVYYSIYGHLATTSVHAGDSVTAGQFIGTVGMTGNTSGPHLHLQIDRGEANEEYHTVYWPTSVPSSQEADTFAINPITFIQQF